MFSNIYMSRLDRNSWMDNINNRTLEAWRAFSELHDLDQFNHTEFNNWFNNHGWQYATGFRSESPIPARRQRASMSPGPPQIQRRVRRVDVVGVSNPDNTNIRNVNNAIMEAAPEESNNNSQSISQITVSVQPLNISYISDASLNALPQEVLETIMDPITMTIMSDPVINSQGRTYDRSTLMRIIQDSSHPGSVVVDPFSRQPISGDIIIPNIAIRDLIQRYFTSAGGRKKKTRRKRKKTKRKSKKN